MQAGTKSPSGMKHFVCHHPGCNNRCNGKCGGNPRCTGADGLTSGGRTGDDFDLFGAVALTLARCEKCGRGGVDFGGFFGVLFKCRRCGHTFCYECCL